MSIYTLILYYIHIYTYVYIISRKLAIFLVIDLSVYTYRFVDLTCRLKDIFGLDNTEAAALPRSFPTSRCRLGGGGEWPQSAGA